MGDKTIEFIGLLVSNSFEHMFWLACSRSYNFEAARCLANSLWVPWVILYGTGLVQDL